MGEQKSDLLNFTGLWAHETKPDVYTAKVAMGTACIRRNVGKQTDKDPDWLLSFGNDEKMIVDLAGLYHNESKAGKEYLAGNFGSIRIMCFFVEKKTDKHPDISVCFTKRKERADNG